MSHRNPDLISLCHLHELLLSLLPSVPSQNSSTYSFLPASRPSQLLAPHNRLVLKTSAQATEIVRKVLFAPEDVALAPTSALLVGGGISCFFYFLLCASAFLSAVTFPSANKTITLQSAAGSPVFLSAIRRGCAFRYQSLAEAENKFLAGAFESCCCLISFLYLFSIARSISALSRSAGLFSSIRHSTS